MYMYDCFSGKYNIIVIIKAKRRHERKQVSFRLFADQARNAGHIVQICKISIWVWKLLWCCRILVLLSCACELYIVNIPHFIPSLVKSLYNYANIRVESCPVSNILSPHRFLVMMIEILWMLFGENLDLKSSCRTGKLHWKILTGSRMSLRVM